MSVNMYEFDKENLNYFLKELAKEIRKEFGRNKTIELILVGGAAVITQYHFRPMSMDIDADIPVDMKSIINRMADKYNLPRGWLNADFKKTASYSPRLRLYSKPYRIYSKILEARLIADEYLIAMKLKSARQYKRDLSDVVGIVKEMREDENDTREEPLNIEQRYLGAITRDNVNMVIEKRRRDKERFLEKG